MLGELIGVGEAKTLKIREFDIDEDEDTIAGLQLEDFGTTIGIGASN